LESVRTSFPPSCSWYPQGHGCYSALFRE
jgi:hypothetical protein